MAQHSEIRLNHDLSSNWQYDVDLCNVHFRLSRIQGELIMANWISHFQSDKDVHGLEFAAKQAKRKGIPCAMVIGAIRAGWIK